jgi:hypothetical protein
MVLGPKHVVAVTTGEEEEEEEDCCVDGIIEKLITIMCFKSVVLQDDVTFVIGLQYVWSVHYSSLRRILSEAIGIRILESTTHCP